MPARAPVASPATTGTRRGRVSACAAVRLPRRTAPCTSSATAAASGTTDTRSTQSSVVAPTSGRASVPIGSPVQFPSPVNSTAPTPPETKQGTMATMTVPLAIATTSSSRITATSGLPKMVAIAAADPASAMSLRPCGSDPSFVRSAANSARPPPRAISGASGPITAPSDRPARAASVTPGRLRGSVSPPPRPSAGTCPPWPGRYRMAAPTARPARRQHRQRQPGRRSGPAELVRQPLPDQLLQPLDPGQEAERDRRQRQGEHGRGDQQQDVPTAAQHRVDVRARARPGLRGGRGRGLAPRGRSRGRAGRAVVRRVLVASHPGASPSSRRCARALRPRRPPRSTLAGTAARVITPGG